MEENRISRLVIDTAVVSYDIINQILCVCAVNCRVHMDTSIFVIFSLSWRCRIPWFSIWSISFFSLFVYSFLFFFRFVEQTDTFLPLLFVLFSLQLIFVNSNIRPNEIIASGWQFSMANTLYNIFYYVCNVCSLLYFRQICFCFGAQNMRAVKIKSITATYIYAARSLISFSCCKHVNNIEKWESYNWKNVQKGKRRRHNLITLDALHAKMVNVESNGCFLK